MGAKPGRMKGNEQKAEYRNRERKHGKPGFERTGKAKEAKAEMAHRKSRCEAKPGRVERKKQKAE